MVLYTTDEQQNSTSETNNTLNLNKTEKGMKIIEEIGAVK